MATVVANAVDLRMQTVFSRMLIAFALFTAPGCALPDRTFNRMAGIGHSRRGIEKSNASVDQPTRPKYRKTIESPLAPAGDAAETIRSETNSQVAGVDVGTTVGDTSQISPGHSSLSSGGIGARSASSRELDGDLQTDSSSRQTRADRTGYGQSDGQNLQDSAAGPVAERPATRDDSSLIQLQGLEFDDVSGTGKYSNSQAQVALHSRPSETSERTVEASKKAVTSKPTSDSGKSSISAASTQLPSPAKSIAQLPPLPWQSDLEQLIARIEKELAQSKPDNRPERQNDYLRKQAQLRMLYLMAQRQEDALTAIPDVDTTQQEYWQQMLWALSNSFDTVQFPELSERAGRTVTPLNAALRLMREEAEISIKNMTFCRKISYFGNYERFPRNEFTPGYEVLLYTEIENFVSTPTVDGQYRTSLKSLVEITDSTGKVVWTKGFPPTEDLCRNPRRDYFHNYQFHIPEDLATGTYTLKLTIVDELSHKRASNSLNFVLK